MLKQKVDLSEFILYGKAFAHVGDREDKCNMKRKETMSMEICSSVCIKFTMSNDCLKALDAKVIYFKCCKP